MLVVGVVLRRRAVLFHVRGWREETCGQRHARQRGSPAQKAARDIIQIESASHPCEAREPGLVLACSPFSPLLPPHQQGGAGDLA
eukprot:177263-Chlamydomonas_euryale.AAC.1